jgi:hypothetical protein
MSDFGGEKSDQSFNRCRVLDLEQYSPDFLLVDPFWLQKITAEPHIVVT